MIPKDFYLHVKGEIRKFNPISSLSNTFLTTPEVIQITISKLAQTNRKVITIVNDGIALELAKEMW